MIRSDEAGNDGGRDADRDVAYDDEERVGRSRRRNAAATRAIILQAATDLFAARGYDGTSIVEVANAAGYTIGAVYRHFKSKSSLLLEVVKFSISHVPPVGKLAEGASGADMLGDLLVTLASPELHRVRQLTMELHAVARADPEVARLLAEFSWRRIEEIADLVQGPRPGPSSECVDRVEALGRASIIMMLMVGISHIETISPALVSDTGWQRELAPLIEALTSARQ